MISPEGWTRRAGGLGITLILYSEEQRRCKLVATVMRFDAQSRKAKMIAEAGTIEMIVQDPIRFRIGTVLPKHRDDFRSIRVGDMPAVRGPLEGGVGGKIWVGEQVLGFRDNLWLRIKAYAIDPNDDAGHLLSSQGLDALLSSLRIN